MNGSCARMRCPIKGFRSPRSGIVDPIFLLFLATILKIISRVEVGELHKELSVLSFVDGLSPLLPNHRVRKCGNEYSIISVPKHRNKGPAFFRKWTDLGATSFSTSFDDKTIAQNRTNESLKPYCYSKSHSLSVCLVPPSPSTPPPFRDRTSIGKENTRHYFACDEVNRYEESLSDSTAIWKILTTLRLLLEDPGFFRWPPHINLLYPFLNYDLPNEADICSTTNMENLSMLSSGNLLAILGKLRQAARRIEPFWVEVDLSENEETPGIINHNNTISRKSGFGTFGNSNRGVLWIYPKSYRNQIDDKTTTTSVVSHATEPIVDLQLQLEKEFPMCAESLKTRSFLPHMTLSSKFASLEDALHAQATLRDHFILSDAPSYGIQTLKYSFLCKEFYLLERNGDNGQFKRRATISLGNLTKQDDGVCVHDPPLEYNGMPQVEEDWIAQELQILKDKRKTNRKKNNRARGTSKTRKSYRARKLARKKAEQISRGKFTS